jgi:hypothetical protein
MTDAPPLFSRHHSVFVFISATASNKCSLGAANSLVTVVAIQRMVGPAAAASPFRFSLANSVLGGGCACVASQLRRFTWQGSDCK